MNRVSAEPAAVARVGFAGLGVMGLPMAGHLLDAGFDLTVWNRTPSRTEVLVARGARAAETPLELGAGCEVIVTMLTDDAAVESVCRALIGAASPGTTIVDMSSVAPATARRLHELSRDRGVDFLDAPVSGGERAAQSGTLAVMVGGDAPAVERSRPVLDAMARKVVHVGGPGAGDVTKAVNQVIVGLNIQAVAEGLRLAIENDLDPAKVLEAIEGGFASSTVLREHGPRMVDGNFEPGARLALHLKDLGIALELADSASLALPATAALAELMADRVEAGDGGLDHAAIVRAYQPVR